MFFGRRDKPDLPDLSYRLRDEDSWKVSSLNQLGELNSSGVMAVAVEPLTGLLAIGTDRGSVFLFGNLAASGVRVTIPGAPYRKIRFIAFAQSVCKLVVVGAYIYYNGSNSGRIWSDIQC